MDQEIQKEKKLRAKAEALGLKIRRVVNGVIETEDGKFFKEGEDGNLVGISQAEAEKIMNPAEVKEKELVPSR